MPASRCQGLGRKFTLDEAVAWLMDTDADTRRSIAQSWQAALAGSGEFAAEFYARVFASDPAAATLFPGDMTEQRRLLTKTMSAAIALVDEPEDLLLLLRASGARHAHYGVVPRQFDVIGAALIDTVADRAAAAFGAPQRDAWTSFYAAISAVMLDGMRRAAKG